MLLAAIIAVASCLIVLVPSSGPLRIPATIALVFVLPGYTLLHASGLDRRPDPLERIMVIAGTGTALVVVIAIAIGLSPVALNGATFAVVDTAGILAGLVWAGLRMPTRRDLVGIRGLGLPCGGGRRTELDQPARMPRSARSILPSVAWSFAVAVTFGSILISSTDVQLSEPAIVQLWMVPQAGGARLGIYNGTAETQRYHLVITPRGVAAESVSFDVPLGSKMTWQEAIAFSPSWLSAAAIDAKLYETASTAVPMRSVWVDVPAVTQ